MKCKNIQILSLVFIDNSLHCLKEMRSLILLKIDAFVQGCSVKKVFLEVLQNSLENTCARVSFFNKVEGLKPATLLKRDWHMCFPVNFVKFLRTPFLVGQLW